METNISVKTGAQSTNRASVSRRTGKFVQRSEGAHNMASHAQLAPQATATHKNTERQSRFFDGIITFSLVALFFGVPLFFTSLTMQGIAFDKQMYFYFWILVATVTWATKSALTGELTMRRTALDLPIVGLIVVTLISVYLSDVRWQSLWGMFGDPSRSFIAMIAGVVAFYLIVTHFTWERFRWFFGALLASGVVVTVWTFLGMLGIGFLPESIAVRSPLSLIGSPRGLSLFLSAMLPLFMAGIFGLWSETAQIKKVTRNVLTGVLGAAILLAVLNIFSLLPYTPVIALVVGAALFLIFVLAQIVRPYGALSFIPMIVLVAVAGFLMFGSPQGGVTSPFINQNMVLPPEVVMDSSLSWEVAKSSLGDAFFFGYGPSMYGQAFALHRPESFNEHPLFSLRFVQGEGVIFDSLSTIGVIGTVMLALVFLTFFGVSMYLITRNQENNKIYSLGFLSAIVMLAIAAMMYRIEGGIILFGVLVAALGWAVLYHESKMSFSTLNLSLKASPKFALTLAFVSIVLIAGVGMSFFFVGKVFVADVLAGKAVQSERVEVGTIQSLERAYNLNSREGRYLTRIGQEQMVLANREALKAEDERNLGDLRTYLANAQIAALSGREQMPVDVLAAETYAQIVENASYYDTALLDATDEAYVRTQELEPVNPLYAMKRGEIALRKAVLIDPEQNADARNDALVVARDYFTQAIEKKRNLAAAHYQRALIKQALEDLDGAIEDMQNAFAASGNANITYAYNLGVLYKQRDGEDDAARAELLFRSILGVNDKEINTHLELATLYEQKNEKAAAIDEYQIALDLLAEEESDAASTARQNIQDIINRLRSSGESVQVAGPEVPNVTTDAPEEVPVAEEVPAPAEGETPAEQ